MKTYVPTAAERKQVVELLKKGERTETIAAMLRLSLRTFVSNFGAEMKQAERHGGPSPNPYVAAAMQAEKVKKAAKQGLPPPPPPRTPVKPPAAKPAAPPPAAPPAAPSTLPTELPPWSAATLSDEQADPDEIDDPDDVPADPESELAAEIAALRPEKGGTIGKFVANDAQRRLVIALTANGLTHQQIAAVLDTSVETLERHFVPELSHGFTRIYAAISGNLVRKALGGDRTCIIFWLKAKAGWRETTRNEVTGADGNPLDLREVSTKDLLAAIAATERASSETGPFAGDEAEDRLN